MCFVTTFCDGVYLQNCQTGYLECVFCNRFRRPHLLAETRVLVKSCVYLGNKEVGGVDLFWEGHDITPAGIVHPNI